MLTILTGTVFIYQGQELGMVNVPRSWDISEYLDINTVNYYKEYVRVNGEKDLDTLMDNINLLARDHARTPVQWDSSANGGFSTGKPWMRTNDNFEEINAASQVNDPDSLYNFYKKALQVRKEYKDLFIYGKFEILDFDNEKTFTIVKTAGSHKAYAVMNFTNEAVPFEADFEGKATLILANENDVKESTLGPWESRVYLIEN